MAHGVPSTIELIAALRSFLEEEVTPGTEGRLGYMSRVAGNVAAAIERELAAGETIADRHARRLERFDAATDARLTQAIRAGELDDRFGELIDVLRGDVIERLSLWNPRYVEPGDSASDLKPTSETKDR